MSLGIAVIGAGRIGALHARHAAGAMEGAHLVAVVDADIERARHAAGKATATTILASVLADPAVNAVVIASPTPVHAQQICEAAAAGKAIFCEKPISLDLADATDAVEAASKVPFQIGFQRRYDPGFVAAHMAIQQGTIGHIEMFRAITCDPEPAPFSYLKDSGGIYADMAIHDIDVARFLCGDVAEVTAMGAVHIVPDLASVHDVDTSILTLRFASGAIGVIQNSRRAVYGYEIRTEVLGEKGKLVVEEEEATALRVYDREGIHSDYHGWFLRRFREAYRDELQAFVDAVRKGTPPTPGPGDAIESLRVALAARRSLESRVPVRVNEIVLQGR